MFLRIRGFWFWSSAVGADRFKASTHPVGVLGCGVKTSTFMSGCGRLWFWLAAGKRGIGSDLIGFYCFTLDSRLTVSNINMLMRIISGFTDLLRLELLSLSNVSVCTGSPPASQKELVRTCGSRTSVTTNSHSKCYEAKHRSVFIHPAAPGSAGSCQRSEESRRGQDDR